MKYLICILIATLIISSCQQDPKNDTSNRTALIKENVVGEEDKQKQPRKTNPALIQAPPSKLPPVHELEQLDGYTFIFEDGGTVREVPRVKIYARFDKKRITASYGLGAFQLLEPNNYEKYHVPKDALAACLGVWKDAEQILFLEKSKDGAILKIGQQATGNTEKIKFQKLGELR